MNYLVIFSIAFGLSELTLLFVKRSKRGTVKTKDDRGSLIVMWLFITFGFTFGFILSKPVTYLSALGGIIFILSGLVLRWLSILQLGKSFTVDVAITDSASLKTDGIYSIVRHPSYSGLIIVICGFAIAMSSIYSFLVFVVPVLLAIVYRISVEEKVLVNEFGNSYVEYRSRTKKIIPGIF